MRCPLSVFFCWRPSDVDRARVRAEAQADALAEAEAAYEVGEPILSWTRETAREYHPSVWQKTVCPDCRDLQASVLGVLGVVCGAPGCANSEHLVESTVDWLIDYVQHQHPEKG